MSFFGRLERLEMELNRRREELDDACRRMVSSWVADATDGEYSWHPDGSIARDSGYRSASAPAFDPEPPDNAFSSVLEIDTKIRDAGLRFVASA